MVALSNNTTRKIGERSRSEKRASPARLHVWSGPGGLGAHLGASLGALLIPLALLLPASTAAQTLADAARANFMLATKLCLQTMLKGSSAANAFQGAGFTYRREERGVNSYGVQLGPDHYFDAPSQTTHAEVMDPSGHPGLCSAYSRHMAEPEAAQLVGNVIAQLYPGAEQQSGIQWYVRGAAGFDGGLPLIVGVSTVTRHRYEAPGTVQVSMSFPG